METPVAEAPRTGDPPAPAAHPHVTGRAWVTLIVMALVSVIAATVVAIVVPNVRQHQAAARAPEPPPGAVRDSDEMVTTTEIPALLPPAPPPPAAPVNLPGGRTAPVVSRVPTADKAIFLGIDDGIVRDPAVLGFLRRNQIPFTMFLTDNFAKVGDPFWRDAVAAGGTIEDHTLTHPDLRKLNWNQLKREICGTADRYQREFGVRPTLFRPPYGLYDDRVRATVASCGMKAVVLWRASTNDGRLDVPGNAFTPGDVLLLHWRADLLENLEVVVARCREQGFTIARLQDYLG